MWISYAPQRSLLQQWKVQSLEEARLQEGGKLPNFFCLQNAQLKSKESFPWKEHSPEFEPNWYTQCPDSRNSLPNELLQDADRYDSCRRKAV